MNALCAFLPNPSTCTNIHSLPPNSQEEKKTCLFHCLGTISTLRSMNLRESANGDLRLDTSVFGGSASVRPSSDFRDRRNRISGHRLFDRKNLFHSSQAFRSSLTED